MSNLSEERRLARVLRDGRTSFLVDDVDQSMVMSSQQRQKWAWIVVFYGSNHLVNDLGHGTKILHVSLKRSFKRTHRNKKYNTNNESRAVIIVITAVVTIILIINNKEARSEK